MQHNTAWAEAYPRTGTLIHAAIWPQYLGQNWGVLCPIVRRERSPDLTQCRLRRGLPPYQVAS